MQLFIVDATGSIEAAKPDNPVKAYRRKKNAQAECDRLNVQGQGQYRVTEVNVAASEIKSYAAARDLVYAAGKKARDLADAAFKDGARRLFDLYPELQSFGWRQYTPSYCDGDLCMLVVWSGEPDINGMSEYDVDDEDEDAQVDEDGDDENSAELLKRLQPPVAEFLESFNPEDLGHMFGDPVCVTVRRSGDVEVYEFDPECGN